MVLVTVYYVRSQLFDRQLMFLLERAGLYRPAGHITVLYGKSRCAGSSEALLVLITTYLLILKVPVLTVWVRRNAPTVVYCNVVNPPLTPHFALGK